MKKIFTFIAVIAIIGLAFFGCKEEDTTPQEHSGTITAFGKTITVKGDASISKANFEKAKGKLNEAMADMDKTFLPGADTSGTIRNKIIAMLERPGFAIIIEPGNAGPNADANKSMTIGIDYLLNNDTLSTIAPAIVQKLLNNAFA